MTSTQNDPHHDSSTITNETAGQSLSSSQAAEPRFEQAIAELEEIVKRLTQPNIELDEAINLYERGVRLAQRGRHLISDAESRVNQLRDILNQPEGGGGDAPRS